MGVLGDLGAAIGQGIGTLVKGFMDILKALYAWLVSTSDQARKVLDPWVMGLTRDLYDQLTAGFLEGSPPKEIEEKVQEYYKQLQERLKKVAKEIEEKSGHQEAVVATAVSFATSILAAQTAAEGAATAADAIHPTRRTQISDMVRSIITTVGLFAICAEITRMPILKSVVRPLDYATNELYPNVVPGPGDLVRFVVREAFPLEELPEAPKEFVEYMKKHGYNELWARAYWWSHWELPARTWIDDAFHRGELTEEEWANYIRWHDYAPFPRPGISKSDIEILRALRKRLIPRVEARRGWEFGKFTHEKLVEHYRKLGYEDDAELMAEIEEMMATDAERAAVARAAGRIFRETIEAADEKLHKGEIDQAARNRIVSAARREFEQELKDLKYPKMIRDLWIRRYELEARVKSRPWEIVEEAG